MLDIANIAAMNVDFYIHNVTYILASVDLISWLSKCHLAAKGNCEENLGLFSAKL